MHDQPLAGALDRDLVEQAGRDQRLQRRIARGVVESAVGRRVEIGAHGLGIDAAIAFDHRWSSRGDAISADGRCAKIKPSSDQQQPTCSSAGDIAALRLML